MPQSNNERWVFGYGSLMWRPGFSYLEKRNARVYGYHRSLCVYSHVHRGTPDCPGLVLGLDRGGACCGMAFRVDESIWTETVDYLRIREQTTGVYLEAELDAVFQDGERQRALTYIIDRKHHQYAGKLETHDMLKFVTQGIGQSGHNPEYVLNTYSHLKELGVRDRRLADLAALLQKT